MSVPLVSIITVTLNAEHVLEKTIASVFHQTYTSIEYLIIDGGSTDSTLEIIQSYKAKITYWHSKKDRGIYDAMNQGIKLAKGEALLMLNAGDWLEPTAIEKMVNQANGEIKDKIIACHWQVYFDKPIPPIFRQASFDFHKTVGLCHQGVLIGKNLYDLFGLYDDTLQLLGDYDFYVRVWKKKKESFIGVPFYLAHYQYEGLTTRHALKSNHERWKVINRYFTWYEAIPIRVVTLSAIIIRSWRFCISPFAQFQIFKLFRR
ncbi:MAG: glycosyltransferase family 2 protein [Spirosomataceae bacterium]